MSTQTELERLQQMAEEIFDLMTLSWIPPDTQAEKDMWDLSEQEVLTLEILAKCDSMSVGDLQRKIGVPPTKMSRIIGRLEREAAQPLIECKLNPTDRRKINVSITETGTLARRAYRSTKLAGIVGVLAGMPEADRAEFMRLLGSIRARLLEAFRSKQTPP
jgi:DNA-binding MarR family transcriptional regulator